MTVTSLTAAFLLIFENYEDTEVKTCCIDHFHDHHRRPGTEDLDKDHVILPVK